MPIITGDKPEVVFIRRADHLSKHSGQVAFPGGMWESDDASLLETALRESEEEISLPRSKVEPVGKLDVVTTPFAVRVTPYVGFIPEGLDFVPEASEIDSIFQVPLDFLLTAGNYSRDRFPSVRGIVDAPCLVYGEYCIWGLTFKIMLGMFSTVFGLELDQNQEIIEI